METILRCRPGLYPKLLGDAWWELGEDVRRLHPSGGAVHAVGVFQVRHGSGWLARALARLARLPPPAATVHIELVVTAQRDGEEWRRTFGGQPLVSLQLERPAGLLAERIGPVEMRFRLQVVEGALIYQTTSAALCLGSLRVPLPGWLSPRIRAWEKPVAELDQIAVAVEVHLPLIGRLIAYDGNLTQIETQR